MARVLKNMGEVLVRRGLFEDGLAIMESSLEIYEDLGYHWGPSDLAPFLAEAHLHLGQYEQARARAERAVEVYACATGYPFVANSRWFQDLVAGPWPPRCRPSYCLGQDKSPCTRPRPVV